VKRPAVAAQPACQAASAGSPAASRDTTSVSADCEEVGLKRDTGRRRPGKGADPVLDPSASDESSKAGSRERRLFVRGRVNSSGDGRHGCRDHAAALSGVHV
jgi:hypothetical protein